MLKGKFFKTNPIQKNLAHTACPLQYVFLCNWPVIQVSKQLNQCFTHWILVDYKITIVLVRECIVGIASDYLKSLASDIVICITIYCQL